MANCSSLDGRFTNPKGNGITTVKIHEGSRGGLLTGSAINRMVQGVEETSYSISGVKAFGRAPPPFA